METWYAYIAGLFDGEGSVSIARVQANGLSDYHKIVVTVSQRAKHREALDRIHADFGGRLVIREQPTRVAQAWAQQAVLQIQAKPEIERFLSAIAPYSIIKREQIRIGLEFIRTFKPAGHIPNRLGQFAGRSLTIEEIERRERLRLELREANLQGPPRVKPSALPPLDVSHRDRSTEDFSGDASTIRRGEARPDAKLTDQAVREIRRAYQDSSVTQAALAERYGVSLMLINGVVNGKRWRHVTPDED